MPATSFVSNAHRAVRAIRPWYPILAGALLVAAWVAPVVAASSPALKPPQLLQQLRQGGYVLVMRHAQSPDRAPSAQEAEADNPGHERQLDAEGKASAQALGSALHALGVSIGPIYVSPTYRARETVQLAGLGPVQPVEQLAEGPRGMSGAAAHAEVHWLQQAVEHPPPRGRNTLIVTHTPNILGAFGPQVSSIQAGEMLVFDPHPSADEASGHARLIGRLTIAQWRELAASQR
jgi:phosphohistidine phosphatase SixA